MESIKVIEHGRGGLLLRLLGLGPSLAPVKGISQVQGLLDRNSSWAKKRTIKGVRKMIANSSSIITLWENKRLIGFGRSTSDYVYRGLLWDVIVEKDYQKRGLGKLLVKSLLESKSIKNVEKIYLMTTNCREFYEGCGFVECQKQLLLNIRN